MKRTTKMVLIGLWMMFIFYMSHQIAIVSLAQSYKFKDMLVNIPIIGGIFSPILTSSIIRKSAHIFLYFVLAILTFKLIYRKDKDFGNKVIIKKFLISLAVVFLYACTDEFHQLFVPGRSGEFRDVMIDTLGGCLGLCTMWIYIKLSYKKIKADN